MAARVTPTIATYRPRRAAKKIRFPILLLRQQHRHRARLPPQTPRYARTAPQRGDQDATTPRPFRLYHRRAVRRHLVRDQVEFLTRQLHSGASTCRFPQTDTLAETLLRYRPTAQLSDPGGLRCRTGARRSLTNHRLLERVQAAHRHLPVTSSGRCLEMSWRSRLTQPGSEFVLLLFAVLASWAPTVTPVNPSLTDASEVHAWQLELALERATSGGRGLRGAAPGGAARRPPSGILHEEGPGADGPPHVGLRRRWRC